MDSCGGEIITRTRSWSGFGCRLVCLSQASCATGSFSCAFAKVQSARVVVKQLVCHFCQKSMSYRLYRTIPMRSPATSPLLRALAHERAETQQQSVRFTVTGFLWDCICEYGRIARRICLEIRYRKDCAPVWHTLAWSFLALQSV